MKSLVTGATGLIGHHVVRALLARGDSVRALCLPGEDARNLAGLDLERVDGDVSSRDDVQRAARGVDRVFHLAALYALWTRDPARLHDVNVEGTRNVLTAAGERGIRVVHTSSIARFGGQGLDRRATESSPFALGPSGDAYSVSKYVAHELAVSAAARGADVVICAPTGPIGPGDVRPTPTGRLLLEAITRPFTVVVPTMSNLADVRDMAEGHVLAAERGARGETYLLGGKDHALVDLARLALALAGLRRPVRVVPFAVASVAGHAARWLADHVTHQPPPITPAAIAIARLGLAADCSKAARELGLQPRPLRDSVRDALRWFASEGFVRDPKLRARLLALPIEDSESLQMRPEQATRSSPHTTV